MTKIAVESASRLSDGYKGLTGIVSLPAPPQVYVLKREEPTAIESTCLDDDKDQPKRLLERLKKGSLGFSPPPTQVYVLKREEPMAIDSTWLDDETRIAARRQTVT
jgi:hypothetical protein